MLYKIEYLHRCISDIGAYKTDLLVPKQLIINTDHITCISGVRKLTTGFIKNDTVKYVILSMSDNHDIFISEQNYNLLLDNINFTDLTDNVK